METKNKASNIDNIKKLKGNDLKAKVEDILYNDEYTSSDIDYLIDNNLVEVTEANMLQLKKVALKKRSKKLIRLLAHKRKNNKTLVRELLDSGDSELLDDLEANNIFVDDDEKEEVLMESVQKANNRKLSHIVKSGYNITTHKDLMKIASAESSADNVKILADKGFNVNEKYKKDKTPLMNAVWYGNLEVVKELLKDGADKNAVSDFSETAMTMAKSTPHANEAARKEIIELLK